MYWATLFVHRGDVYLLGTSQKFSHIVIMRSSDGGRSWTQPTDGDNGLLFVAGERLYAPNYHGAPTPVVEHEGRLYRAFEDFDPPVRPGGFKAFVISCDADADLLKSGNWRMSNKLAYDQACDPDDWGGDSGAGWLEGNIVPSPEGLVNVLRLTTSPVWDKAAIVRIHDEGSRVTFESADFIEFPGGSHKFTIRRDPLTGLYFTLSNKDKDPDKPVLREVLSLFVSSDLRTWTHLKTLLVDDLLEGKKSRLKTGFQYVDWQFDGADILYVVRASYAGAHTFHDSNRIVYGEVGSFRELLTDHSDLQG
ncbi:hypothetical protein [Paenibacillus oceani]|nr:hypothetical protein [Paenibacillus oceani]